MFESFTHLVYPRQLPTARCTQESSSGPWMTDRQLLCSPQRQKTHRVWVLHKAQGPTLTGQGQFQSKAA